MTLDELAAELQLHPRSVKRVVKRYQVFGIRRPAPGSRSGQRQLSWTREQAEEIKARRLADGFMP